MTTLSIFETRRMVLPIETVVEAVLQFDRDSGGSLAEGTIIDATIESEPALSLALTIRASRTDRIEQRGFRLPAIAAAIINYCRQTRIPLPRGGKKTLEMTPDGLAFCIQTEMTMPRWHSRWEQPPRRIMQAAEPEMQAPPPRESASQASAADAA